MLYDFSAIDFISIWKCQCAKNACASTAIMKTDPAGIVLLGVQYHQNIVMEIQQNKVNSTFTDNYTVPFSVG